MYEFDVNTVHKEVSRSNQKDGFQTLMVPSHPSLRQSITFVEVSSL